MDEWRALRAGGWRAEPGGGGGSSDEARLAKLLASVADKLNGWSCDDPASWLGTGDGDGDGEGDGDSDSVRLTADLLPRGTASSGPKRP